MGRLKTLKRTLAQLPKRKLATLESLHDDKRVRGTTLQNRNRRLMQRNALCVECEKEGKSVMVDEWDHIVPLWNGGVDNETNIQGLCFAHHKAKSERERLEREMHTSTTSRTTRGFTSSRAE